MCVRQVIQQQAAAAPAGSTADSEDSEHCRGEYSRYYTTIQQIGKGAFGFVKLSYRNGDRMLVGRLSLLPLPDAGPLRPLRKSL